MSSSSSTVTSEPAGDPAHHGFRLERLFRQSEIQHLGLVAVGDKNVGRLDVAVNDALGVRRLERVRDLDGQLDKHIHLQGVLADALLESLPLQQFHGDEIAAVGLPDLIDGADVRVIQGRGGPGLALEALQRRRVFFQLSGQELQSDVPAEVEVFSFVHHTHAAAAKLVQDAVVGNGFAGHQPRKLQNDFPMVGCAHRQVNVGGL